MESTNNWKDWKEKIEMEASWSWKMQNPLYFCLSELVGITSFVMMISLNFIPDSKGFTLGLSNEFSLNLGFLFEGVQDCHDNPMSNLTFVLK